MLCLDRTWSQLSSEAQRHLLKPGSATLLAARGRIRACLGIKPPKNDADPLPSSRAAICLRAGGRPGCGFFYSCNRCLQPGHKDPQCPLSAERAYVLGEQAKPTQVSYLHELAAKVPGFYGTAQPYSAPTNRSASLQRVDRNAAATNLLVSSTSRREQAADVTSAAPPPSTQSNAGEAAEAEPITSANAPKPSHTVSMNDEPTVGPRRGDQSRSHRPTQPPPLGPGSSQSPNPLQPRKALGEVKPPAATTSPQDASLSGTKRPAQGPAPPASDAQHFHDLTTAILDHRAALESLASVAGSCASARVTIKAVLDLVPSNKKWGDMLACLRDYAFQLDYLDADASDEKDNLLEALLELVGSELFESEPPNLGPMTYALGTSSARGPGGKTGQSAPLKRAGSSSSRRQPSSAQPQKKVSMASTPITANATPLVPAGLVPSKGRTPRTLRLPSSLAPD